MKKKQKQNIFLGIGGLVIIVISIFYFYSAEQTQISGYNFGNNLQYIQDELKKSFLDFESKISMWKEGELSKEEFLENSEEHFKKMNSLILEYDNLVPPKSFISSVELFKLSAENQLESDKEFVKWVKTGDESAKIRSNELIQESFQYELAALEKFNAAKAGINP